VLCRSGHLLRIRPDLGFDSKITARYAAVWPSWKTAGIHPNPHKNNTPPSRFSAWEAVPPSPRSAGPAERRLSLIHHCAPHTTPYWIRCYSQAALLLRFQRRRRGLDKTCHACLSTKQNTACAPPCGAIPAQATSTPSLGAWGSIPHLHTLLVVCVTRTVTSNL
jgi:hypothetical protein